MQEKYDKSIFTDCLDLSDKNTYLILKPNVYIYIYSSDLELFDKILNFKLTVQ